MFPKEESKHHQLIISIIEGMIQHEKLGAFFSMEK